VYATVGPSAKDLLGSGREWQSSGIARIDIEGIAVDAQGDNDSSDDEHAGMTGSAAASRWNVLTDWSPYISYLSIGMVHPSAMRGSAQTAAGCPNPEGLAVDDHSRRLFVACDDQELLVIDSVRGELIDSLTTGPGTDAIAYDESRGLIFTANGGGYGSVTVIRKDVSDSYAVIQNLPTMERARTMAVDSSTGRVYLVTDLHGVKLNAPPANGIGGLKMEPVQGSFQVLVVGN
jgi:DNA-binding beta-propeller fold protein YncE